MDKNNLQSTDIKKVWEMPTVTEISKSEILGVANAGADAGLHT